MTMTWAGKTTVGCDPGSPVVYSNTGPDQEDACNEWGSARATWTYEHIGHWKYSGNYSRDGVEVTGSVGLEDGQENTPVTFGGTLSVVTPFTPDEIGVALGYQPWDNFPGRPFHLNYYTEGTVEITTLTHETSYLLTLDDDQYRATLSWSVIPRPEQCT